MSPEAHVQPTARQLRRRFFAELALLLRIIWPILSGISVMMAGCGILVSRLENWRIDKALYSLRHRADDRLWRPHAETVLPRLLAMIIGLSGIVVTGLFAAVSVEALRGTARE